MHQHHEVLKARTNLAPLNLSPKTLSKRNPLIQFLMIGTISKQNISFDNRIGHWLYLRTTTPKSPTYGTWMHPVRKYSILRASSKLRLPPSTLNKWEYAPGVDGKWLPIHGPSSRVMYMHSHTPLNMIQSSILLFQRHLLWYSYYDKVYSTPRTPRCWIYPPCSI